jgi:hypothetical protein
MVFRADLDVVAKEKIPASAGNQVLPVLPMTSHLTDRVIPAHLWKGQGGRKTELRDHQNTSEKVGKMIK